MRTYVRDNKSEALCELSSVNVKVDERVSNFTFTLDLSYIASILLRALRFKAVTSIREPSFMVYVYNFRLSYHLSFFLSFF